jgi:hypothetical protein
MKQRPRIYYSDTQKALMWERWKQGWILHEIGKLFDRAHSPTRMITFQDTSGLERRVVSSHPKDSEPAAQLGVCG